MAQLKFTNNTENNSESSRVSFFSLKNDGDEAIVRFMHDSTDDFDIISSHSVEIDNKFRKVNCVKLPYEDIAKCPLCNNGIAVSKRVFIHLIHYTRGDDGKIVAEPKVWERPMKFAYELKDFIAEYGPLSNCVFKVKRNGAAGSMQTSYSVIYLPQQTYPETTYTKNVDAFDNYHALGTVVYDKSFADLQYFLDNGSFPEFSQGDEPLSSSALDAPVTPVIDKPGR